MNKIFLIGNLTRDPETRVAQSGNQVCRFGLAVNRRRGRSQQQDGQPEADFFNCVCFGKTGELAQQYLQKGRKVSVVGTFSLNQFTGQDGQQRMSAEVVVDDLEFLPNATSGGTGGQQYGGTPASGSGYYGQSQPRQSEPPKPAAQPSYSGFTEVDEDELPF